MNITNISLSAALVPTKGVKMVRSELRVQGSDHPTRPWPRVDPYARG